MTDSLGSLLARRSLPLLPANYCFTGHIEVWSRALGWYKLLLGTNAVLCLTREVNRNCPKYSPWLYMCDVSSSILLGYQHRYKALSSLTWLVSCSGGAETHLASWCRVRKGWFWQCASPGGISPFPRIGQHRIPLSSRPCDLFQDPDHEDQWASKNLLPWENMKNYSTRAVPAFGPAWASLGMALGEWLVVDFQFTSYFLTLPYEYS